MGNRILALIMAFGLFISCKSAEDYFSEGQNLSADGKFQSAIGKYKLAIEKNQYLKDSYIQTGVCYQYLNMYDSALIAYGALLKLYPDNTAANYYSGVSKYRQGKYKEAVIFYDRSLDSRGGFHGGDTSSIQTLIDMCKDHFESENAEIDIPTCEILYDRAIANFKSGRFKNACDDYSDCITQDYNPGTSYYMIGLCRMARKEIKFARQAFYHASNYGDSLAIKKLSFLENPNYGHFVIRKKA